MSEQKKPEAGEWWEYNGVRIYIVGHTRKGLLSCKYKDGTMAVLKNDGDWWQHLPDCDSFDWQPEPVESPDEDWVTQDRVPARARIDQEHWSNWGVDEWHTIGPNQISSQRKMMHGNVDEQEDTLSLRCRRRDLPPLPQETPKREYVKVWLRWGNDRLYATTTSSDDPKDRELKHDGTGFYLEDGK